MPSPEYILIPASNPLCQELQRGHNNCSAGALLSSVPHHTDRTGEWLVGPIPDAPNPNEPYANVLPGDNTDALPEQHKGKHIYFVRFWTLDCKQCGKAITYKDRWNEGKWCNPCAATKGE